MSQNCEDDAPGTSELIQNGISYQLALEAYHSIDPQCNYTSYTPGSVVYTNTNELLLYLHLLDTQPIIRKFLQYDCCYRLADKYLIAMVFIYFKRAQLNYKDYTYLNFFGALCLAHSMEEEDPKLCTEIYDWALGRTKPLQDFIPQFLELKMHLWQAMDHRAAVSHYCCRQVISIAPSHPVWQRERTPVHGGAPREYFSEMQPPKTPNRCYDEMTNTCAKCRSAMAANMEIWPE